VSPSAMIGLPAISPAVASKVKKNINIVKTLNIFILFNF
jgi:hypothetical protein